MLSRTARRLLREIEKEQGWGIGRPWTKKERQALLELKFDRRIMLDIRGDEMTAFAVMEKV